MTVEVIGVRQHLVDDEIVVLLLDPAAELFIPILIGPAKPAHILTPSVTARGIVNLTAIAVVEAQAAEEGQPTLI